MKHIVVPFEPTEDMIREAEMHAWVRRQTAINVWRAMIDLCERSDAPVFSVEQQEVRDALEQSQTKKP